MLKAVCVQTPTLPATLAAADLLGQADKALGIYRPQAGILYTSQPHDVSGMQALLSTLAAHYPGVQLIACTVTAGFTRGDTRSDGYQHDAWFLCLLVSESLQFRAGLLPAVAALQAQAGAGDCAADGGNAFRQAFAKEVAAQALPDVGLCLVYPPYHAVNAVSLVDDIQQVVGDSCLVFGGCSTDYWPAELALTPSSSNEYPIRHMWHGLCQQGQVRVEADAMPYLLVSGQFDYALKYTCGWLDSGDHFPISVDGTTLTHIDDVDAYPFLLKMGHPLVTSRSFTEYPLWIHEDGKEPYQRDIFLDRTCGRIHSGFLHLNPAAKVSFSFPDRETLLDEHRVVMGELHDTYDLSLVAGCSSRVLALRGDIGLEAQQCGTALPRSPLLGAYMFGEIFPHGRSKPAVLNSATSAVLAIRVVCPLLAGVDADTVKTRFLQQLLSHKSGRIAELEQQLEFFENSKLRQENRFLADCLGVCMSLSGKSISALSEVLEGLFKQHYQDKPAPYPTSRGKLIARLNPLKKAVAHKFGLKTDN